MPIYAYKCAACGHAADVLQKMSADPLTECPVCGKSTYSKQVTAPSFQLKGSGWYVTDFKGEKKPASAESVDSGDAAKTEKPAETRPAGAEASNAAPATAPSVAPATSPISAPAASPAPAPAPPASSAKPAAAAST